MMSILYPPCCSKESIDHQTNPRETLPHAQAMQQNVPRTCDRVASRSRGRSLTRTGALAPPPRPRTLGARRSQPGSTLRIGKHYLAIVTLRKNITLTMGTALPEASRSRPAGGQMFPSGRGPCPTASAATASPGRQAPRTGPDNCCLGLCVCDAAASLAVADLQPQP